MSTRRVLIIGAAQSATGYGRVVREIGSALRPLGEIVCIQVGPDDGMPAPGLVLPNPHPYDFGAWRFVPHAVHDHAPDAVVVLHDLTYVAAMASALAERDPRCAVITYSPIEGEIVDPAPIDGLRHADAVVLYTHRDAADVGSWLQAPRQRGGQPTDGPRVCWIPHGVDCDRFRPLCVGPYGGVDPALRSAARRRILGEDVAAGISFLALNANRQVPRKRLDVTLEIFAAFAADKPPSVKLLFKTTRNKTQTQALQNLAAALGVSQRILWTDALGIADSLDDASLNLLYNACDVGLNTSEAEGWGLIPFEHAATGAPQVLPAHAAATDLWRGYPGLIGTLRRRERRGEMFACAGIDAVAACEVLQRLYWDPAYRQEASLQALRIAQGPDLDWSVIGQSWRALVTELIMK
jgi:D-inositol-3-phosphate glycosyltransferase